MREEILRFVTDRLWLFVGLIIGTILYFVPHPEGLSPEGWNTLIIAIVATLYFITAPVPLPAVGLMIVIAQILLRVLPSENPFPYKEVARSFWTDSVFFITGSLMLAQAIVKQRLDKRIAYTMMRLVGTRTHWVSLGLIVTSALIASFIGEHTVAAMLLPVVITLVTLSYPERRAPKAFSALLLFSVSYGCSIAGIGTISGGARNAIMIDYWSTMFGKNVSYGMWMTYCYPIVLIQIPVLWGILYYTFRPELRDLSSAYESLKGTIAEEGPLRPKAKFAIGLFLLVLLMWITLSDKIGLGNIAIIGATLYLCFGLVEWEDISRGVNWGVVFLYAAAISLGNAMDQTGAAKWVALTFLKALAPLGFNTGIPLLGAIGVLVGGITNTMSNGAAVAVLGPITLNMGIQSGTDILHTGFATAIASSFAYLTVIGTPACTIIYGSGLIDTKDFLRAGSKMFCASIIIMLLFARIYWRIVLS